LLCKVYSFVAKAILFKWWVLSHMLNRLSLLPQGKCANVYFQIGGPFLTPWAFLVSRSRDMQALSLRTGITAQSPSKNVFIAWTWPSHYREMLSIHGLIAFAAMRSPNLPPVCDVFGVLFGIVLHEPVLCLDISSSGFEKKINIAKLESCLNIIRSWIWGSTIYPVWCRFWMRITPTYLFSSVAVVVVVVVGVSRQPFY
jgi:hypothetical protein